MTENCLCFHNFRSKFCYPFSSEQSLPIEYFLEHINSVLFFHPYEEELFECFKKKFRII